MNDFFEGKKVLIVAPHEDDELNLAGGLLLSLNNKENYMVAFVTNGDFIYNAKVRQSEAIKSLKKLKIKKFCFLGYGDQAYDANSHMYNIDSVWQSRKGRTATYSMINGINDFSFAKTGRHSEYSKKNLVKDLKMLIEQEKPEIIITTDLDFHPDHLMTSFCVEKALGIVLQEQENYTPLLLKAFTYENCYFGPNDFFEMNDQEMKVNVDDRGFLRSNEYYTFTDALKITTSKKCLRKSLIFNPFFRNLKVYKSQILIAHAPNIINPNNLYWVRRSDSLTYKSYIETSSGDASLLSDFLLCDTGNVLNGNSKKIVYEKGVWKPSDLDKEKFIDIKFEKTKSIKYLNFYHGLADERIIDKICIEYNNKSEIFSLKSKLNGHISVVELNGVNTDFLKIKILDDKVFNGFSEIEVFDSDFTPKIRTAKILLGGGYGYNYFCSSKSPKKVDFCVYRVGYDDEMLRVELYKTKNITFFDERTLVLSKKSKGEIKVFERETDKLVDCVSINKNRQLYRISALFGKIYLLIHIIYQKIYRRVFIRNRK